MNKNDIDNMSDEEIQREIARLKTLPVPKERTPGAPPRKKKEPKPKAKPSWKDELGL